jgi:hypothetical protein
MLVGGRKYNFVGVNVDERGSNGSETLHLLDELFLVAVFLNLAECNAHLSGPGTRLNPRQNSLVKVLRSLTRFDALYCEVVRNSRMKVARIVDLNLLCCDSYGLQIFDLDELFDDCLNARAAFTIHHGFLGDNSQVRLR